MPVVMVLVALTTSACQHIPPRPLPPERTAALLETRRLDDPEVLRFVARALGEPLHVGVMPAWDMTRLTLAALYFQPSMGVVRAHAALVGGAVVTASALPNPTLSVTPEYGVNPMGAVSPWVAAVHVDWTLETAGKRRWRIRRAEADADAARIAIVTEAWRVRRQLATTLVALGGARARAAALAEEAAATERLAALGAARVTAGAASTADLAPLRVASLQTTVEGAAAESQIAEAEARVAAALGVPARSLAGVALPSGSDVVDERDLLDLVSADARRRALLERSDVQQAVAAYTAAEAALGLQLARQYPDVHLGPGYQFDQGQNKWSVGLSVDLPILNRNEGPIAEAVAARDEAGARLLATQATVLADLEQALARRAGERARAERLRALLGDRETDLGRVGSAFAAGAVDRATLVAAEVERSRAARAAAEAEVALAQALVDLEAAVEGPIPSLPPMAGLAGGAP
ncbi:MAG: TolC family protein [Candidatus Binatia bacterium]